MNTGDEMSKKGEKSYFSNLLHNLSDSCTKNISHCQTKHRSSSKDRGQEHKMFLQSSRNRNFSQCGIQNYLSESYFLCDGRKCLHKERTTFYLLPTKIFERSSLDSRSRAGRWKLMKKVLSRPHPSDPESSVALLMHPSAKVTVTFLFGMQSKVYQWWGHPDVRFFTSQFKMKNIHTFFYMFPLKSPRKSCTLSLNSASRGSSD